jgi:glycosyltransferase involved in cell wall biosynthesis
LFVPAHTLPIWHPAKTVVTIHDIGFERVDRLYGLKPIGPGGWSRRILSAGARLFTLGHYGTSELDYHRWATEFAIKHARKIITVSQFSKEEIMDRYQVDDAIIDVVHHGIDRSVFRKIDDWPAIRSTLIGLNIPGPFLLYVGRLEEKKNTPGLIEIFHILKTRYKLPHQLVLAGKPGLNYDRVERLIAKYGLDRAVVRPGYIDEASLVHLRNAADVFVFPSLYEGFGMPILESMACGTPVVCSNSTSLPEVADDAAVLVNPENYEEFAAAVQRVISQPNLRADLISRGWQRIKSFRWSDCAEKTLEIIKSA